MTDPSGQHRDHRDLRRRAEARLRDQIPDVEALSAEAARELVRELRTTQVELEVQNEDLQRAQEELAAARDRYADLFDHAPVGYVTLDAGGRIQEANLTFAELVSRERGRLIGQPLSQLVDALDSAPFAPACGEPTRNEARRTSREVRMRRDDRETFWASVQCVPEKATPESGVRCAITDITAQKREQFDLRDLEEGAREARELEAVGQLAGGIAHDFNNLLSVVLGYGDILLAKFHPSDPRRRYAERIVRAGRRSAELTRELLAFGRRQTLRPELVDLNHLLRDMGPALEMLLGPTVPLEYRTSYEPGWVEVDPEQIRQTVLNLATNAREAMPEGGCLTIETRDVEIEDEQDSLRTGVEPGNYVVLIVTDTGRGMDEETLEHAFEPFFTTRERASAAGLGLSAAYGIIRQSGGNIRADSAPGRGTTIRIFLPLSTQHPAWGTPVPLPPPSEATTSAQILVVDDEEAVAALLGEVLEGLGYQVLVAGGGAKALRLQREEGLRPDLVISDVVMPGMSGPALVERLRLVQPDLKVLFVSGYGYDAATKEAGVTRDSPFLRKPFSLRDLEAKVRDLLPGP